MTKLEIEHKASLIVKLTCKNVLDAEAKIGVVHVLCTLKIAVRSLGFLAAFRVFTKFCVSLGSTVIIADWFISMVSTTNPSWCRIYAV